MTERAAFKRLSAAEALRALYIDFEGEGAEHRPPVLLGVHRRGRGSRPNVHGYVLDPALARSTDPTMSLHDAVLRVVQRAERNDRRIVAWTEHELKWVNTLGADDPDLVRRFTERVANAKRIAERWRNRLHGGDTPADGKLSSYLRLIGYPVPSEAVGGDVGQTIRDVRARFERGHPPTLGQAERWRRVNEHNRHDCIGMRRICLLATRELEATTT
jgi:hypothetical protein